MGHNEMKIRREEKIYLNAFAFPRETLRSLIKHFTFSRKSLACNVVKCLCSLAEMWLLNKLSHSDKTFAFSQKALHLFAKMCCFHLKLCVN